MTQFDGSDYLTAIESVLTTAGLHVGDGVAPKSSDGSLVTPCAVMYLQPSTRMGDCIASHGEDARITFRIVSADRTGRGAARYDWRVREALDSIELDVDGRTSYRIRWENSSATERDDDVTPPCFYVSTLFSLLSMSTAAAS